MYNNCTKITTTTTKTKNKREVQQQNCQSGERLSELEDNCFEMLQSAEQQERLKKAQGTLHDTINWTNKCIKGVSEGKEERKW